MVRFEPISAYISVQMLNTTDSLTIGKTFIGEIKWQIQKSLKKCLSA
jgi:hypothetical protein